MEYLLFDVFAEEPFAGNQLAVFPNAAELDAPTMQRLANELNIAESIFLSRTSDERQPAAVRIFTPRAELPFAGHPTIGATIAIADVLRWVPLRVTEFSLKERVGDVAVRVERDGGTTIAWLRTPRVIYGKRFARAQGAAALNVTEELVSADLPVQVCGAGSPLLYIPLVNKNAVDDVVLNTRAITPLIENDHAVGVFVFSLTPRGTYARMFAPMTGITEDPATGGATGPLYAYLLEHGALPKRSASYRSEQGVKMGRRSVLHVRVGVTGDLLEFVDVGGQAIHVGGGTVLDRVCYHHCVMFNRDAQQQQGLMTT